MSHRLVCLGILLLLLPLSNFAQRGSLYFNGVDSRALILYHEGFELEEFTIECWIKKGRFGTPASTGSGGVRAMPIISKGLGNTDHEGNDVNFFLGVEEGTNHLCADFETGVNGSSPGANNPIFGTTEIKEDHWYHVAATYNAIEWRLYVNGQLDASKMVYEPIAILGKQHIGLGTGFSVDQNSTGAFHGNIDELRIWSRARSQKEIIFSANTKIRKPQPDLVANWPLDSMGVNLVEDWSGNGHNGLIIYTQRNYQLTEAPFNIDTLQNHAPVLNIPSEYENICIKADSLELALSAKDTNDDTLVMNVYIRPKNDPLPFTLIALPDAQFYTQESASLGSSNRMFKAQTQWIVDHSFQHNIAHTMQLGDCTQNGDNGGDDIEWKRADTVMSILEDVDKTPDQPDGLSYTMCVGNHDQSPIYDPSGTTHFFNQYFGVDRFEGRYYWGGNFGHNADNSYQLFSASGLDFIVISVEFDEHANPKVLEWADSLLKAYPTRNAIIVGHFFINTYGIFGTQGRTTYDALKNNPNLMLMLCGHARGEAVRSDVFEGRRVYTMLSNYQSRERGGSGWMRIMKIAPSERKISVQTYSPWLDEYEYDDDSHFELNNLNLNINTQPYQLLLTDTLVGDSINFTLTGFKADTAYEWYTTISDGKDTVFGPVNTISKRTSVRLELTDSLICVGGKVTLRMSGGKRYDIVRRNTPIISVANDVVVLDNFYENDAFRVAAHHACGFTLSRKVWIDVIDSVELLIARSDSNGICQSEPLILKSMGIDSVSYYLNDTFLTSEKSVEIENIQPFDSLKITGKNQCFTESMALKINFKEQPEVAITQLSNVLASNFTSGNQWYFDDNKLESDTHQFLLVQKEGFYSLEVTNEFGCVGRSHEPFSYLNDQAINQEDETINIFPNPASSVLHIQTNHDHSIQSISIVDPAFREVHNCTIQAKSINIDTTELSGTYLVFITDNLGNRHVKKVLIY